MKKVIIYLSVFLWLCSYEAQAQLGFTQSATGQSSVLYKGSNINLNVTDASIGMNVNNLDNILGRSWGIVYGASASGKSAEGLSGIFSGGDFVPDAKIEGFLGVSFSNVKSISVEHQNEDWDENTEQLHRLQENIPLKFKQILKEEEAKVHSKKSAAFVKKVNEEIDAADFAVTYIQNKFTTDDESLKPLVKAVRKRIDPIIKSTEEEMDEIKNHRADEVNDNKVPFINATLFMMGGINGTEFKRFTALDTVNYNNSFTDEHFRGGYFGTGVNLQAGNVFLGLTYTYNATNNFELLSKKEYNWKRTYTSGSQTLTEEKKITAYKGAYSEIAINKLNVDLVFNFRIDSQYHVLLNPYLRATVVSENEAVLPKTTDMGIGAYLFNKDAKFMGGLYVELADINNNYEKLKPVEEQNLRKPLNRLSFGLTAKFSFKQLTNSFK
ncbi:MAG: hypothetical protein JSS82_10115 [Bacteroidetes bacterium]|nr:hypothetical protein [Bacteroidota bacterium]